VSPETTPDGYVLGRSAEEYERLRAQARMWEPETARLLDRAGLARGARCLDAGCGPGEVMRLLAERVGPEGEVVGIDVDEPLGRQALDALRWEGYEQCRFEAVDVEARAEPPGAPFDLVYARLVLLHCDDPSAALRRLWDWVAPGGCLVVQDYDVLSAEVVPEPPVIAEFTRVAQGAFRASGRDLRLGLRLTALHVEAGIGEPDGHDAGVRIGSLAELAPLYEGVFRSTLPAAVSFGLTTDADGEGWFREFADYVGAAGHDHTALWPLLVGTWKHKAAG
jgi:SAM-dependent methyltransferase